MTCTERARRMGLADRLSEKESQPLSQKELHDILHELLKERFGITSISSEDAMLAKMSDEEYELLWLEAVRRMRKRKLTTRVLAEQRVYS